MTAPLGQLFELGLHDPVGAGIFRDAVLERDWREREGLEKVLAILPPMVRVPAGQYLQGSPEDEPCHQPNERQRLVTIRQPFWLGAVPVTQALYEAVTGSSPSHFRGPDLPVERVSWMDCQVFLAALNELLPGFGFRLPTEAEWEHAARAGTTAARYGPIDDIAWHYGNSSRSRGPGEMEGVSPCGSMEIRSTHAVGRKAPNAWGLHDMLGNVWEWCADSTPWPIPPYPPDGAEGPTGSRRVIRGGSWSSHARLVHAAFRFAFSPGYRFVNLGFRLAGGAP